MPDSVRNYFEPRFGRDFSNVRIHTGASSERLNRDLNSQAFTLGDDIHFSSGSYRPGTSTGDGLIAHELTHVAQQGGGSGTHVQRRMGDGHDLTAARFAGNSVLEAVYDDERLIRRGSRGTAVRLIQQSLLAQGYALPRFGADGIFGPETDEAVRQFQTNHRIKIDGIVGPETMEHLNRHDPGNVPSTPGPVSLTYTTVAPKTNLGCGGFTWGVRWGLNGATAATNGFVVQQLTFNLRRERCAGGRNDFSKTYWEAWQVRGGNIFVGTSHSPHNADTFSVPSTPDQRGVNFEEGQATYIDGYAAPLTWGHVPEALSLPATMTMPAGWNGHVKLLRWLRNDFDCCAGSTRSDFTSHG